jgi:DNA repair protein RadC
MPEYAGMKIMGNTSGGMNDAPGRIDIRRQSTAELLVRFLEIDLPSNEALRLVLGMLEAGGGLRGLFRQEPGTAPAIPGLERHWRARFELAGELSRRRLLESLRRGRALTSPADTVEYLQTALRDRRREIFTCLFLDTRHRVIAANELFQGSIDGACVYPRVVAERALRLGAAAVIVAHNHPSGVSEPSLADQAITRRLKDALALLEIRLLDHFVIGDGDPVSMASRGML